MTERKKIEEYLPPLSRSGKRLNSRLICRLQKGNSEVHGGHGGGEKVRFWVDSRFSMIIAIIC